MSSWARAIPISYEYGHSLSQIINLPLMIAPKKHMLMSIKFTFIPAIPDWSAVFLLCGQLHIGGRQMTIWIPAFSVRFGSKFRFNIWPDNAVSKPTQYLIHTLYVHCNTLPSHCQTTPLIALNFGLGWKFSALVGAL